MLAWVTVTQGGYNPSKRSLRVIVSAPERGAMAWYPAATRMELQPESDAQAAIRPTRFILHSIAAPWTARRMYEYWRADGDGAVQRYCEACRSRYAAAARSSSGLSRNLPSPWLHAPHTRPRTHFPHVLSPSGQQP